MPNSDRHVELDRQDPQGADIVGIDAERLLAESVSRIRFLADKSAFHARPQNIGEPNPRRRDLPRASV